MLSTLFESSSETERDCESDCEESPLTLSSSLSLPDAEPPVVSIESEDRESELESSVVAKSVVSIESEEMESEDNESELESLESVVRMVSVVSISGVINGGVGIAVITGAGVVVVVGLGVVSTLGIQGSPPAPT